MQKTTPDISVLMPVYNDGATVEKAIQSILSQTHENFELLLVDDGSGEETSGLLQKIESRDSRVRLFHREHSGIVGALNYGLNRARGQLIARMDADDWSWPERLELQCGLLGERPDIGLASSMVEFGGNRRSQAGYAAYVDWTNQLLSPEQIALNRFVESPIAHPTVMFRRELAAQYGGYREGDFPEDYELWLRWMDRGVQMAKVPEVLLRWNDPTDRLSRTDSRYSFQAFYEIKAKWLAEWLARHNPCHPDVVIWGAGRTTRKRAALLEKYGVQITAWVDIDPNKIGHKVGGCPVLSPEELPEPGSAFVVGYVGRRGAREEIRSDLEKRGYRFGQNALSAA
ncbi:MAG: glycosyltransferase [Balneolaceae bacterium]